jgi:murein DD-endopeptidase MepM/ murein hydrolase activator NlpD
MGLALKSFLLLASAAVAACSTAASQPPPSLSPTKKGEALGAQPPIESLSLPPAEELAVFRRSGQLAQGGLSFWKTKPGSQIFLDGEPVPADGEGHFALGFDRDHAGSAELVVILPDGSEERRTLAIEDRAFPESRIDGLPPSKVTPYSDEDLTQIRREQKLKAQARATKTKTSYWRSGFAWPVYGRISGVYGSQRILNGEPKRPHSGTDVAAPPGTTPMQFQGTEIRAPSAGIVTLAREGMFFEGGLILIDHGQEIESAMLHLSRVDVKPGDVVVKGEVIGAVGMTGRATGPHLHWTVNWKGQPMDAELLVGDIREAYRAR